MLFRLIALISFVVSTAFPAFAESTWDAYVVSVEDGNTVTVSTKNGSNDQNLFCFFTALRLPHKASPLAVRPWPFCSA